MNNWIGKSSLDRDMGERGEVELDDAWDRAFVLEVTENGGFAAHAGVPLQLDPRGLRHADDILLGAFQGRPWFARRVTAAASHVATWRDVDAAWQEPVAAAVALVRWHAMSPHCERCGEPTRVDGAGVRRLCQSCGLVVFPRQDPAVIVAVLDPADRLLLASHTAWPPQRVSVIAGFVEAGESLEQACWREVAEEVGVTLDAVSYVSSQPWPMPRSLMLGFVATTSQKTVHPDGDEIAWGRFWTRRDLRHAMESAEIKLPGTGSIGRQLIESWLAGTLQGPIPKVTEVQRNDVGNKPASPHVVAYEDQRERGEHD
ncbi:MAG: NAD(+) diphosphatase [Arachnia sp.]